MGGVPFDDDIVYKVKIPKGDNLSCDFFSMEEFKFKT